MQFDGSFSGWTTGAAALDGMRQTFGVNNRQIAIFPWGEQARGLRIDARRLVYTRLVGRFRLRRPLAAVSRRRSSAAARCRHAGCWFVSFFFLNIANPHRSTYNLDCRRFDVKTSDNSSIRTRVYLCLGDSFIAGVCHWLNMRLPLEETLKRASRLAGFKVGQRGVLKLPIAEILASI